MKVFTRQQLELLKKSQRELHDLLPEIDKAEDCGIECSAFREIAHRLSDQLARIEQSFMQELQD